MQHRYWAKCHSDYHSRQSFCDRNGKLRTGRGGGVPCHYQNTLFVKVYASDGNAQRRDGDQFLKTELQNLLRHAPQNCIVGGNFNCFLSPLGCNNEFRQCKTPEALRKQCSLNDTWTNIPSSLLIAGREYWKLNSQRQPLAPDSVNC